MKQIVVTVRAIIIHQNQLFMCQHNEPGRAFYNLAGGRLEVGETITEAMIRELTEETGVTPQLGHLMFINQFIDDHNHRVEFFFHIRNSADYVQFDTAAASHAHEVGRFCYGDPADPSYDIRPHWLAERWSEIVRDPTRFQAEIISSS